MSARTDRDNALSLLDCERLEHEETKGYRQHAEQASEAAEAEAAALRVALVSAEAALADIGDSDREPGDDLRWCERRASEVLPAVRAALSSRAGLHAAELERELAAMAAELESATTRGRELVEEAEGRAEKAEAETAGIRLVANDFEAAIVAASARRSAAEALYTVLVELHHGRMPDRMQDAVRAYEAARKA